MANLSIKDVPESLAEALRRRAARNHRSLQGELMAIIEQAAGSAGGGHRIDASSPAPRKTIEQIYAEHLERFPQPLTEGPLSVDIIRQDRDSR